VNKINLNWCCQCFLTLFWTISGFISHTFLFLRSAYKRIIPYQVILLLIIHTSKILWCFEISGYSTMFPEFTRWVRVYSNITTIRRINNITYNLLWEFFSHSCKQIKNLYLCQHRRHRTPIKKITIDFSIHKCYLLLTI